ncbi:MAG: hypothetical protein C4336_08880 [Armatimonadota bacterium]
MEIVIVCAVLALVGGMLVAWWGRRVCVPCVCPPLQVCQRLQIEVSGDVYSTLLYAANREHLELYPPLRRGLPVRFEAGTHATLSLATSGGLYTAKAVFTGYARDRTQGTALLIAQVRGAWRMQQRRRHPRWYLPKEVAIEAQANSKTFVGWVQDISEGGMRLFAPIPLPEGMPVHLELPPSLRGYARFPSNRLAHVLACERALHHTEYQFTLRLAFTDG